MYKKKGTGSTIKDGGLGLGPESAVVRRSREKSRTKVAGRFMAWLLLSSAAKTLAS